MQEAINAIAHPGRRALLRLVLDRELPVSELAKRTGVSQPAASQHPRATATVVPTPIYDPAGERIRG